jgi:hypothetical protein
MKVTVVEKALADIKGELADFDPALVTTGDAAILLAVFTAVERAGVAGQTLVASRAAQSRHWKDEGHRSPASWVAATTGTGPGRAQGLIENSEAMVALPQTSEALVRGELSGQQLKEIAATAGGNPGAEGDLLEAAKRHGLKGLREECLRVKARSVSETEARARHEQIRKNRSVQMWTDHEGVGRLEARLAPDDFARVATAVRAEANAVFHEARRAGHRESTAAYEADALVALVTGTAASGRAPSPSPGRSGGSGSAKSGRTRPPTMMHLRVDLAALRRGHLEDGEVCEIPGVGPVPLATAVNEVGDAILKVIISDGVDVRTVTSGTRAVPARIRTALEDRDGTCVVPGCDVRQGLETDHYKIGFAQDGPTELANLARLCHFHHYLKTHCGYEIGGDPGSWEWKAPESESNPVLTS